MPIDLTRQVTTVTTVMMPPSNLTQQTGLQTRLLEPATMQTDLTTVMMQPSNLTQQTGLQTRLLVAIAIL